MFTPARRALLSPLIVFAVFFVSCASSRTVCPGSNCCAHNDACFAPQYVIATGQGHISTFQVTPGGPVGPSVSTTTAPSLTLGMAALNNQFLYVSTFLAPLGQPDLFPYSIGQGGALNPLSGYTLGQFSVPSGLATDNALNVVYVADAGKIDALQADASGALTPVPNSPFTSGSNLFLTVDPQNRFLFASDQDPPGGVLAFTISPSDGELQAVQGSPFPVVPGGLTDAQLGDIVVDSSGKFVFTTITNTGQVAAFTIATPSGALNPVPGSPFPAGNNPLMLAVVGNYLYVSNTGDRTISGYQIDATTGILTALPNSPFAIPAAAMVASPFGNAIYVSGSNGIQALALDASGNLTPAGSAQPFPGATALVYVQ